MVGEVARSRIIMSGGHAVAAVAHTEASESRGNTGPSVGSSAALTGHWPVVSVDLSVVHAVRETTESQSFCTGSSSDLFIAEE